ncbi:MAG: hypothetical protein H8E44_29240 [Planctomycetes bacterium]|nr:hypothetical protein [Planctomycetota bacterium]MBL7042728.1 hypothetical protein [Pirellulaceae bacterium]
MASWLRRVSERDRVLIACELHDGFLQKAIAAKMHLEACQRQVGASVGSTYDRGHELLSKGIRLVEESITEVNSLMTDLCGRNANEGPDGGLIPAIQRLASELQDAWGLEITVHVDGNLPTLDAELGHHAYHIVQECLRNACRHSKSQTAEVTVTMNSRFLGLAIRDSGIGFCPDSIPPGHFGLQGISHRVESLGGRLEIASAPGSGTYVYVVLPVDSAQTASKAKVRFSRLAE